MYAIGMMAMPADFRYREVFLKGRPKHDRLDAFRIRHPQMDVGKRAKIFAPFDALSGLHERLAQAEEEHSKALNGQNISDELHYFNDSE